MSLLAEKFNNCPSTRLKVLCLHRASLLSTPGWLRECQAVGVENGKMVVAQGMSESPWEGESSLGASSHLLFFFFFAFAGKPWEWAKAGCEWQRMHSFAKHDRDLLCTGMQVKEYGNIKDLAGETDTYTDTIQGDKGCDRLSTNEGKRWGGGAGGQG